MQILSFDIKSLTSNSGYNSNGQCLMGQLTDTECLWLILLATGMELQPKQPALLRKRNGSLLILQIMLHSWLGHVESSAKTTSQTFL